MLRADFHVHTAYSSDCRMTPEALVQRCQERGINCLAVTDHNTIEGALRVREIAPFPVIVGEEIRTTSGEVLGLFLTEGVPGHLPLEEAVGLVKAQGGLVLAPHPFDRFRSHSTLPSLTLEALLPQIDALEVFNARTTLLRDLERARLFAQRHGLPGSAGSDAHTPGEVGGTYVETPEFEGPEGFLQGLARGRVVGRRSSPLVHLPTILVKVRGLLGRP